jgi:hypothetical protein
VKGARLIGLDLDSIAAGGRPLAESIGELNSRLGMMRNALGDRDVIGLADTLLYEMPPIVAEWRLVLEELTRQVAAPASA